MSQSIFGKTVDYRTTTERNKHSKKPTNTYVTAVQRRTLLQQLGDTCFIIFSYYMEKATVEGFDFADRRIAKALGYPERRIQTVRLALIKAGWFYQSTYKNKLGRKVVMTFLGQGAVSSYKMNGCITPGTTENDKLIDD